MERHLAVRQRAHQLAVHADIGHHPHFGPARQRRTVARHLERAETFAEPHQIVVAGGRSVDDQHMVLQEGVAQRLRVGGRNIAQVEPRDFGAERGVERGHGDRHAVLPGRALPRL